MAKIILDKQLKVLLLKALTRSEIETDDIPQLYSRHLLMEHIPTVVRKEMLRVLRENTELPVPDGELLIDATKISNSAINEIMAACYDPHENKFNL